PPYDQMRNPASQNLGDSYHPDLTMDMGSSLGYSQSIQHHSISMPQPTSAIYRVRRERLQQLRQERLSRQQRRMGPSAVSQLLQRRNVPSPPVERSLTPVPIPGPELQPAAQPGQDTAMIQRQKVARASSLIGGAFMLSSVLGLVQ